jgi:GTP cyclohydrolase I
VRPRGVAVHLEAAHLCTQMRGVPEHGSCRVTTFWRGLYDEDVELRAEFLAEVRAVADALREPGLPELELPDS